MPRWNYKNMEERFWTKVIKSSSEKCWLWQAFVNPDGYGQFRYKDRMVNAHRISWKLSGNSISNGEVICHKCDNPSCVNPKHLFSGTQTDNIKDMDNKGRRGSAIGEKSGRSKLTEKEVLEIRKLRKQGYKLKEISKKFNVSLYTIYDISNRRTWRHI